MALRLNPGCVLIYASRQPQIVEDDWHCGCCKKSMNKTWLHMVAWNLLLMGILARLRAAVDQIPLGYQDETGFHFGVQHPRRD